ncbi:MAG: serine/threonine protein kinase, AGC [Lichina confinis]|nr:MAG: serine/threonine protein kinase, AGC [Lichina confinis]
MARSCSDSPTHDAPGNILSFGRASSTHSIGAICASKQHGQAAQTVTGLKGGLRDFPAEVPSHARDLISRLCSVDPSCRLGNTAGGPNQVAVHPFFADINWPDLYNRTTPGPIVPELEHAADPNNFHRFPDADPEYARMHPYTEDMRNVYDEFFSDF